MRCAAMGLLVLAGCVAPAPAPAGPNTEAQQYIRAVEAAFRAPGVVTARLGQTVRLGNIGVRPIAVTEESRCPHDVECVWAGRLTLRVAISGEASEAELVLGQAHALSGGGALTLVAAAPAPWHDPPPAIERGPANRFGFRRD